LPFEERLAVAFGMGAPEMAGDFLRGVLALAMADDEHAPAAQGAEPGEDRGIIAERAVAMELDEVFDQELDVIARQRAIGMARELDALPRRQLREDGALFLVAALAKPLDLIGEIDIRRQGEIPELFDLRF